MSKIKILVIENDIVIADDLCETLSHSGYSALEPAINYSHAIEILDAKKPDIIILDMHKSEKRDGVDFIRKIKEEYNIPVILQCSNTDINTIKGCKKSDFSASLVNSCNKVELLSSIEIVIRTFVKSDRSKKIEPNLVSRDSIFAKINSAIKKIKFDDILFIKSEHDYVELTTKLNKTYVVKASLTIFIEELPDNFFRTHNSYIVNLDFLDFFSSSTVKIGDYDIPIGKIYRNKLLSKTKSDKAILNKSLCC